jgi:hypothetical protein
MTCHWIWTLTSACLKINHRDKIFKDNKFIRFRSYILLFKCFQINLSFKNHKELSRSLFFSFNSGTIFWALPTANSVHVLFLTPTHLHVWMCKGWAFLALAPRRQLSIVLPPTHLKCTVYVITRIWSTSHHCPITKFISEMLFTTQPIDFDNKKFWLLECNAV